MIYNLGGIVAVCTSPKGGIPKFPQSKVQIGQWGFEGDFHNREMRRSFSKPGLFKTNVDRHITIVGFEVIEDLNRELDLTLVPGSLGENITTKGLGDLSEIKDKTILQIGQEGILLRVIEQNQPCHNLAPLHRLLVKKIYGRRGLLCAILSGVGKTLEPNLPIIVYQK